MRTHFAKQVLNLVVCFSVLGLSGCGNSDDEVTASSAQATGQAESSSAESSTEFGPPHSSELQYPAAEFAYPTYKVTGAVTDI